MARSKTGRTSTAHPFGLQVSQVSVCTALRRTCGYLRALDAATGRGGVAVFGCFAPDGPQHCSGLPVARYSPVQLARQLGGRWLMVSQDREEHITPVGATQPFTWIALRRQS